MRFSPLAYGLTTRMMHRFESEVRGQRGAHYVLRRLNGPSRTTYRRWYLEATPLDSRETGAGVISRIGETRPRR